MPSLVIVSLNMSLESIEGLQGINKIKLESTEIYDN